MDYQMTPFEKEMEQRLLDQRQELLDRIAKSDEDFRALMGSMGIRDSIDLASDDMASKKMEAISMHDASRLRAVDQAIVRVRTGKYGICAKCGKKIPEGRLRAIPFALLCIDCKNADENPRR